VSAPSAGTDGARLWQPARIMQHITTSTWVLCANALKFKVLRGDKGIGRGGIPGEKVGRF
jgi:hypothetical protein